MSNTDKQHRILYNCHKDRRKTPALSEELRAAAFEAERKQKPSSAKLDGSHNQ